MNKYEDIFLDYISLDKKKVYLDPRQMLEALDDASEEMHYSNYHNKLFGRIKIIIREYAKINNIKIGQSRKQREALKELNYKRTIRVLNSDDDKKISEWLRRRKKDNV